MSVSAATVSGLSKSYGGVKALSDVSLKIEKGTIHAVVGENGAGKSTLMKVLSGGVTPDSGTVEIAGRRMVFGSPIASRAAGVGIVHQELSLFPDLTVLANLFIGNEKTRGGVMDFAAMEHTARPWMQRLGLRFSPDTLLGALSIGERQLVEICRALIMEPGLLILDEPNSALSEGETNRLFAILQSLRDEGQTLLFISHRLKEVVRLCDRVTVMRNGEIISTDDVGRTDVEKIVERMLGRAQRDLYPEREPLVPGAAADGLQVADLSLSGRLQGVSLTVKPGEIVGLAGLEGAGIQTLLSILFGKRKADGGTITYPDGREGPRTVAEAVARGCCLVPSDRRKLGLMMGRSIIDNVSLVAIGAHADAPLIPDPSARRREAERWRRELQIRASSVDVTPGELSGGNQQKVVLAKWLAVAPELFILDDPTRGIDIGAKKEIFILMRSIARSGRPVLFHSTEMSELVGVADRILVFYRGRIVGELFAHETDEEALLRFVNTGVIDHDA